MFMCGSAKMLGEITRMEGLAGTRIVRTKKYDYWICFLYREEYATMTIKRNNFGRIEGYETWQEQQANVLKWFPSTVDNFTPLTPIFLQNFWQDADGLIRSHHNCIVIMN